MLWAAPKPGQRNEVQGIQPYTMKWAMTNDKLKMRLLQNKRYLFKFGNWYGWQLVWWSNSMLLKQKGNYSGAVEFLWQIAFFIIQFFGGDRAWYLALTQSKEILFSRVKRVYCLPIRFGKPWGREILIPLLFPLRMMKNVARYKLCKITLVSRQTVVYCFHTGSCLGQ